MSEILDCDPNKGFVAFPVALFDLDLTPGAFRTLAELCRMANTSGQCWPSLAQLGRKLGRSRAAVSGYITELRAVDVVTTEEQKMANGYNYRLRYTVTFWKSWRASLGKPDERRPASAVQAVERRVQPDERPLRTKNHIYKKQTESVASNDLLEQWRDKVGKAPYPAFDTQPTTELLSQSEACAEQTGEELPLISADIKSRLDDFAKLHGLVASEPLDYDAIIAELGSTERLDQLMSALDCQWQQHWRKAPNTYQILRLIGSLPQCESRLTTSKLLKSYLRRWKTHQRSLPLLTIDCTVLQTQYPRI